MSIMKEKSKRGKYRNYDESFKKNAVKMIESGRKVSDVANSLGTNTQNLYDWIKKYGTSGKSKEDNSFEQEVIDLRKKLRQTELERDILKKALSIFSREA